MNEKEFEQSILDRWPKYENGKYIKFGDRLEEFEDTAYKEVKDFLFNKRGCTISNCGGSAERYVILKNGERYKTKGQ